MKKSIRFLMLLMASMLLIGTTSCKQDEATISENIIGTWKLDDTQTTYNQGKVLELLGGVNTDSLLDLITPILKGSSITFNSDLTGSYTLSSLLDLPMSTIYKVAPGTVTISSTLLPKEIKFNVISITATEMRLTMNVADVTTLAGLVDTTSTDNAGVIAMIKELVPAIANIQYYIDNSGANLDALGLNPNPTITMVFKKNE